MRRRLKEQFASWNSYIPWMCFFFLCGNTGNL